jgi:DNA ligase-associated metallophosphoesterase
MLIQKFGQEITLLCEKAIFWHNQQTLLVSDLHLGKSGHFRSEGLAVPQTDRHDLLILDTLLQTWQPRRLLFLGDLFHSKLNLQWQQFVNWRKQYPDLQIVLVKGNHDILPLASYKEANLLVAEKLVESPFIFTHIPLAAPPQDLYNLCGHLHPAVQIIGKGKQKLTFPCFFFGKSIGFLPAFGSFTGLAKLEVTVSDEVYMVVEKKLIKFISPIA